MITTTIMDLITEALENKVSGKFQVTGTAMQLNRIKEDLKTEWLRSGLVIGGDDDKLFAGPFSAISYEGTLIHFVEGDHFSIKEIDVDYSPHKTGTMIYRGVDDNTFKA